MLARHIIRRQCRRIFLSSRATRPISISRCRQQDEPITSTSEQQSQIDALDPAIREHILSAQKASAEALPTEDQLLEEDEEDFIDDVSKRDPKYLAVLALEKESLANVDAWRAFQHIRTSTGSLGSETPRGYRPKNIIRNAPRPDELTIEMLLAAQAHLGHSTSLWHPANSRYIFGIRSGIHIFDLSITMAHLRRACKVVQDVAKRAGVILFVGTRTGQVKTVVNAASLSGACHLFTRWIPGTITNRIRLLDRCALQVVDEFDRPVPGFEEQLGDRAPVKPDLVVCLNPLENYVLLRECALNGIPTIGVVDSDVNPAWVTYPIPANDDSNRAMGVIAGALGRAGQAGQEERRELALGGITLFEGVRGLTEPVDAKDILDDPEEDFARPGETMEGSKSDSEEMVVPATREGYNAAAEAVREGRVEPGDVVHDTTIAADAAMEEPGVAHMGSAVPLNESVPAHKPGMKVEYATSEVGMDPSGAVEGSDYAFTSVDPGSGPGEVGAGTASDEEVKEDRSKRAAKREQSELEQSRKDV